MEEISYKKQTNKNKQNRKAPRKNRKHKENKRQIKQSINGKKLRFSEQKRKKQFLTINLYIL